MSQYDLINTTSPAFGYTGEVATKVIKNNRVLRSSKGKNKGLYNLFVALCYALAETPQSNVMPARLVLYTYTDDSVYNAAEASIGSVSGSSEEILKRHWENLNLDIALTALTAPVLYTAPPYLFSKKVSNNAASIPAVKFTFKIPYTVIGNADKIKLAVLCPNKSNKTINFSDALAFYILDPEACAPPEGKDNAQLLLEWSMYFDNIEGETT
jgi:hypothetical protein